MFKVGDRVEIVNGTSELNGKIGEVAALSTGFCWVRLKRTAYAINHRSLRKAKDEIKKGDRVRFIGTGKLPYGSTGIVSSVYDGVVAVYYGGDDRLTVFNLLTEVEIIKENAMKAGDRVRYIGRVSTVFKYGLTGTVEGKSESGRIQVKFDDRNYVNLVGQSNLEVITVKEMFELGARVKYTGNHPEGPKTGALGISLGIDYDTTYIRMDEVYNSKATLGGRGLYTNGGKFPASDFQVVEDRDTVTVDGAEYIVSRDGDGDVAFGYYLDAGGSLFMIDFEVGAEGARLYLTSRDAKAALPVLKGLVKDLEAAI